ncbi:hypothetical protein EC912_105263 [Luteibacter rhizovicinus]|uniref:Uncharacterized protein n=1 Tax=Luteibacter rhizovicinus TaxID=242606 RepID=A0A4R3YMG5_9GAMM|nr:DUF5329 family protein [Luteibacter rhizovicinus]TCV93402.1 hypothetical protein EC912_105263 [Luteibacter rhizovicinus]
MLFATQRIAGDRRYRRRLARRIVAVWLLCFVWLTPAFGQNAVEQQKIDYLIASVASLKGATFIRNGTSYDAEKAAAHMRLKLRFAGSRVKTAEDFIVYCATSSSESGIKYTIRFPDGQIVDSATFLRGKLAEYQSDPSGEKP